MRKNGEREDNSIRATKENKTKQKNQENNIIKMEKKTIQKHNSERKVQMVNIYKRVHTLLEASWE